MWITTINERVETFYSESNNNYNKKSTIVSLNKKEIHLDIKSLKSSSWIKWNNIMQNVE